MNQKKFYLLTLQMISLKGMELSITSNKQLYKDIETTTKALYICHSVLLPEIKKAHSAVSLINCLKITPAEAINGIDGLSKDPFFTTLRFRHPKLFRAIGNASTNDLKKISTIVDKSNSPNASLCATYITILKASQKICKTKSALTPYAKEYHWKTFAKIDPAMKLMAEFMQEFAASENDIELLFGNTLKAAQGNSIKSLHDVRNDFYKKRLDIFELTRIDKIIAFIEGDAYKNLYKECHAQLVTSCTPKTAKKSLHISVNGENNALPQYLGSSAVSWKKLISEAKKEVVQSVEKKQIAADKSFVSCETTEYVVIEDPRNEMQIIIYKTREPESEKAPVIGYHHRVSDLFMMDRAELVAKIAKEKSLSPFIANEAVRQKTPALITDQYIHYAHDNVFIDKSGKNIPNKTLFCRVVQKSGLTKEYFLVWGFLDDGTCYHRGLSFNSSLDNSITMLAYRTRYNFDFPELEKSEKTTLATDQN